MIVISTSVLDIDIPLPQLPSDARVEYRLDYQSNLSLIPWECFHADHILTYHIKDSLSITQYQALIDTCERQTPAMIDIDYKLWQSGGNKPLGDRYILSLHQDVLDIGSISSLLNETEDVRFVKIAINASTWSEVVDVHSLIAKSGRRDVIFSVMGRYGKLQRILYRTFDSSAVYVYCGAPTATGQISLEEANLYHIRSIDSETMVYGILGNEGVNSSKSLSRYNEVFRRESQNAVYLPLPAQSIQEAQAMLFWLQERFQVRGLSITSPFKKELPGSYGKSTIANTFLPAAQQFYNTDVMAFTAALKILNVSVSDSVLIYGTGACAELFVLHLQANGFGNISVSGRDISHVVEFCNALGVRTLSAHNTRFDLLVNCSPLGKSPTNDISKLPTFEKLIDLAYNASITKLVQLAQEQNIPYVDGSAFWELQFVPQFTLLIQL